MIRLAILEQDEIARKRLKAALERKYADEFELYAFSDQEEALKKVRGKDRIDILLAGEEYELDEASIPRRTSVVYLTESVGSHNSNQYSIGKYQKTTQIYQHLVEICREKGAQIAQRDETKAMVIAFGSASGGVGSSTAAAACAAHFAARGCKVMYLNLETFSSAELFFGADAEKCVGLTDVISALKSTSAPAVKTLPNKLVKWAIQDPQTGVFFYAKAENAVNMSELAEDDVIRLVEILKEKYEYVIIDADFNVDMRTLAIYKQAQAIILVSDGSEVSNRKTDCAYWALEERDKTEDYPLNKRISILYNKIISNSGKAIYGLPKLGEIRMYPEENAREIVKRISAKELFDSI